MIVKTVDVFCDICGTWVFGDLNCTHKRARKSAKADGWIYRNKKDICPDCQANMATTQK